LGGGEHIFPKRIHHLSALRVVRASWDSCIIFCEVEYIGVASVFVFLLPLPYWPPSLHNASQPGESGDSLDF
jgi:hypothetical protein